jgi:hypothetical protein
MPCSYSPSSIEERKDVFVQSIDVCQGTPSSEEERRQIWYDIDPVVATEQQVPCFHAGKRVEEKETLCKILTRVWSRRARETLAIYKVFSSEAKVFLPKANPSFKSVSTSSIDQKSSRSKQKSSCPKQSLLIW